MKQENKITVWESKAKHLTHILLVITVHALLHSATCELTNSSAVQARVLYYLDEKSKKLLITEPLIDKVEKLVRKDLKKRIKNSEEIQIIPFYTSFLDFMINSGTTVVSDLKTKYPTVHKVDLDSETIDKVVHYHRVSHFPCDRPKECVDLSMKKLIDRFVPVSVFYSIEPACLEGNLRCQARQKVDTQAVKTLKFLRIIN